MQILITTKHDKGDRVLFNLVKDSSVYGTVTDVVVTRDDATESVKVEYRVRFDVADAPHQTFDAYVLDKI